MKFVFQTNKKMEFGSGAALKSWTHFLKQHSGKVLLLTGKSVLNSLPGQQIMALREERILHYKVSGEPNPETIDNITRMARTYGIEAVAALGGGSVLDTGKAVAALSREGGQISDYLEGVGTKAPSGKTLPFLAMPTTAGTGSEATKNAVISRPGKEGFKKSLRHDHYIPDIAAVDPDFLKEQPPELLARCGMDAFCQLIESYISKKSTPITDALIEMVLPDFLPSLLAICEEKGNDSQYEAVSLGAYISGITLANAGLGTIHGMGGPLGGYCSIPHGTACALLALPVLERTVKKLKINSPEKEKMKKAGQKIDTEAPIAALLKTLTSINTRWIKNRLHDFDISEDDVPVIVKQSSDKDFPVQFSAEEKESILKEIL